MNILIFQEKLPHYRIDIFNEIGSRDFIDLTIVHTSKSNQSLSNKFKEIILPRNHFGPFKHVKGLENYIDRADYVVLMFDLKWSYLYRYMLSKKRKKIVLWGIGISSAKGLKQKKFIDIVRFYFVSRYKALILYSNGVANYYLKNGISENKIFVANNTIKVRKIKNIKQKPKDILFIGTINKRKKLEDLILAFSNILNKINKNINLNIVGDGEMLTQYKELVKEKNIDTRVIFHGRIESQEELALLFSTTLLSISLGQAGLSILHSFSFGVPFMCYNNAINGGELENIKNEVTGLITTEKDLEMDLINILNSPAKLREMSVNCYNLYWKTRTVEQFADKFIKAFV